MTQNAQKALKSDMDCAHTNPFPASVQFRRKPSVLMRLARLGSMHPTRLSFLRVFLRRIRDENWQFSRPVWNIDAQGVGHAVYRMQTPKQSYSLVAFAHDLPADMRTDRVIATSWDATFALFDGVADPQDIARLAENIPRQEAGRVGAKELCMSRANRSVRLFNYACDCLSAGRQPAQNELDKVGYLMRTTAVYGSGKFGAADFSTIAKRAEFSAPFQAEMLTVWLIRQFSVNILEHLAKVKGGERAVKLAPAGRNSLGVGNSTGLGMAPFLIRHPVLLNNWMMAREEALARVRAQTQPTAETVALLHTAFDEANKNAEKWHSNHPLQIKKLASLRRDLKKIGQALQKWPTQASHPWNALWLWGEAHLGLEGQEALLSMMLEPNGALIDGLSDCMSADESKDFAIDGSLSVGEMKALFAQNYEWALSADLSAPQHFARFWYMSAEKLEPRLGERFEEHGAELEHPLGIAHLARKAFSALEAYQGGAPLSAFLQAHPTHRYMIRRAQKSVRYPLGEIQDNLLCATMLPIDLLRTKLAFLGATQFDPRSDRWVRVSLFQNQPYPCDMPSAQ